MSKAPECELVMVEGVTLARKRARGLCQVLRCGNPVAKGRRICERHKKQLYRARNPWRYAWENLKRSAQLRGKVFALTPEEFREELEPLGYDPTRRGCREGFLTVERVDPLCGYVPGNIRPMEFMENSRKGARADRDAHRGQCRMDELEAEDLPW